MHLLIIIPLVIILVLAYLYLRFIRTLSRKKNIRFLFFLSLPGLVGLMIVTLILKHRGISGNAFDILSWFSYLSIGFLSFLLTFLIVRDAFILGWWFTAKVINSWRLKQNRNDLASPGRRTFLSGACNSLIAGSAVPFTGFGIFLAKKMPEVKKVMIPVVNLPDDLNSFSIVQITDIHLSSTCKKNFLEKIVAQVNALKPDVIAFTGDLADGVVGVLGKEAEPLKSLDAKYGKFFVTGNHEYYFDANQWIQKVESLGFNTLINSHELICYKKSKILMAGVTDYRAGYFMKSHRSSPLKSIQKAPYADLKILLAHQPKSIFEASEAGFDIQLSGHTHGGQFFPWQFAIGLDQPYLAGLYKHDDVQLYVSRGTGYWGPPVRMGAPSEITLLKLVRA